MIQKLTAIVSLLSLVIFSSCSLESSNPDGSQPYAAISVYALSPDAPNLNVFLNQNTIAANIPFGSYTLYNQVLAGTNSVFAQAIYENKDVVNTSFSASEGSYYSVFLIDSFDSVKAVTVEDDLQPITGDSVRLRFFNFSPGAPAVDIIANADSTDEQVLWTNRSFNDATTNSAANKFIYANTGNYTFTVVKSNSTDTLATFTNTELTKAGNYTLFLRGFFTNTIGDTTVRLGMRSH